MAEVFPPQEIIVKLLASLAIGLLIGLEREWANKEAGVRSFAITSLFGMLSALLSEHFAIMAMAGIFILVGFLNVRRLIVDKNVEITTSTALMVTGVLGILVGMGHYFTPVAAAILTTILLTWKLELASFADKLHPEEIRSAVFLGLLSFVIFPLLPKHSMDPWDLFSPREVWLTIIVIGSIGFVNYVLLKLYGTKGFSYSAFLGGLVNSTATMTELSATIRGLSGDIDSLLVVASLLIMFAMFSRNLLLLAILCPKAVLPAIAPIAAMGATAAIFAFRLNGHQKNAVGSPNLSSPVSLPRLAAFGFFFLAIQVAGGLAQRFLGGLGLLGTSVIGGLISSASTTAAAANLAARGQATVEIAALATILTSMVSVAMNMSITLRACRGGGSRWAIAWPAVAVLSVGVVTAVAQRLLAL
jgi:uncharacterized membrane protein (DUF4010 family)